MKSDELRSIYAEQDRKQAERDAPKFYPIVKHRSVLCALGLHRPVYLSAEGWVNVFSHVVRRACPCGRYEWVWFEGHKMARQDARQWPSE